MGKFIIGEEVVITKDGTDAIGHAKSHGFRVGDVVSITDVLDHLKPDAGGEAYRATDGATNWVVNDDCLRVVPKAITPRKLKVKSSNGVNSYTVTLLSNGEFQCSCYAWTRRRIKCRHIKEAIKLYGPTLEEYREESELSEKTTVDLLDEIFEGKRVKQDDIVELTPLEKIANTARFRRL